MRYLSALLLPLLLLLTAACDTGDPGDDDQRANDQGLVTVASDRSFGATVDSLETALEANPNITLLQSFSHSDNAASAGLDLDPTQVLIFGNPALGTPLMQAAQPTGIDLPQKMLVYQDSTGGVFVSYNAPAYLKARHALPDSLDGTLGTIGGALQAFAEGASGGAVDSTAFTADAVAEREGLVFDTSAFGVEETYDRLRTALEDAGPISIVAEVNHTQNAASADLSLAPTRLLVFGNPALGTPLMQAKQSIGIDLPQKFLVYENADGQAIIAYNDPFYLAERHGIASDTPQLQQIADALDGLAAGAAEEAEEAAQ